ncbi:MAG: acetyl-CoA carboxylase biotin carboxyl carrier protein subunit [Actinomycetota bacterium]|nr:acetyl-CoA carboxylase biotin carboxyl carrier protein subunit [Actinomycetota bacterium]
MSSFEIRVGGQPLEDAAETPVVWLDRGRGIARLGDGSMVLVEGSESDWAVTVRGRRIAVQVLTARERILAEADGTADIQAGPLDVKATLPGLIVGVAVAAGDEVEAGAPLVTIEAMKMQNEVRAPRPGRVGRIAVEAGQTVATGALLLRLE